jgi:hypothetical protein
MLLEDFALDDFGSFLSELLLSAGDEALPSKPREAKGLAGMKQHLNRDPVCEPTNRGSEKRREAQK